ncbi:MAG: DapH/DapD/GlmU-related protein [Thermoplasmata archaeon]
MTEELEKIIDNDDSEMNYFVDPTAKMVGEIEIGKGCGIWPGSIIDADKSKVHLDNDVYVMPNSSIESTEDREVNIGEGSFISPGARLEGCRLGKNTFVGMDAVVMPGVELGDNVLVTNGSIIKSGTKIPDNSVVKGDPAEVVDEVDKAIIEKISKIRTHLNWKSKEYQIMIKRGEMYDVYDTPKRPDEILEEHKKKVSEKLSSMDDVLE